MSIEFLTYLVLQITGNNFFLLQDEQNHNSSRDIILSLSLSVCLPFCLSLSFSRFFFLSLITLQTF